MAEINDFNDFKNNVLKEVYGGSAKAIGTKVLYATISLIGALIPNGMYGSHINTLSTSMYDAFLNEKFKERFEKNKGDSKYVRMLIVEAVEQIKKQISDEKNN